MEKSHCVGMQKQKIKFWWVTNPKPGNFGDIITPLLLQHFNVDFEYHTEFNAISIGSIAKKAKNETIVLGSGIMNRSDRLFPSADWRFVRGKLTRASIIEQGGKCPEVFGDPALLLPLICDESKKEYDVGIIPHYVDYDYARSKFPNYKVINLLNSNPLDVSREITKCRSVISSSLHGIVCAHAYGIPAAWTKFSNSLKGDDVKFYDHYSAVNLPLTLSTLDDPHFTVADFDITPIKAEFERLKHE